MTNYECHHHLNYSCRCLVWQPNELNVEHTHWVQYWFTINIYSLHVFLSILYKLLSCHLHRNKTKTWCAGGGCSSVLVIHLYPWVYLSSEDVLWLIHLVTDLDVVLGKRYSIASPILCFIAVSVQSVTWVQTYHNHLPNCKGSSNDNCRDRAGSGHTL